MYPSFKSKHGRQSIIYPQNVKLENDYLKVPKIGNIFGKIHREVNEGLRMLASGTGATAEGGFVSPKRGRKKSTVEA